jgi:hypothetical protein
MHSVMVIMRCLIPILLIYLISIGLGALVECVGMFRSLNLITWIPPSRSLVDIQR